LYLLPEICVGCRARPEAAGGTGGCDNVQRTLDGLRVVSLLGNRDARPLYGSDEWEVRNALTTNETYAVTPAAVDDLATAAEAARGRIKNVLSRDPELGYVIDTPTPHGKPVDVCFKGLANLMPDQSTWETSSIIAGAKTADYAQALRLFYDVL
jgi:hypothetical protein